VDEAELGGDGEDIEGEDEDGEERPQARVAEVAHRGMISEDPGPRNRALLYRGAPSA
jgi:hypothetical protein